MSKTVRPVSAHVNDEVVGCAETITRHIADDIWCNDPAADVSISDIKVNAAVALEYIE